MVYEAPDFTGVRVRVPIRTLDSFNLTDVGLIKIDTEGYEMPVLKGAKKTIWENEPRVIAEIHGDYGGQILKVKSFLERFGYRFKVLRKKGRADGQPQMVCDANIEFRPLGPKDT